MRARVPNQGTAAERELRLGYHIKVPHQRKLRPEYHITVPHQRERAEARVPHQSATPERGMRARVPHHSTTPEKET